MNAGRPGPGTLYVHLGEAAGGQGASSRCADALYALVPAVRWQYGQASVMLPATNPEMVNQ